MKEVNPFYVVKYANPQTGKVEHHLFVYNGQNFIKELEADGYLDKEEFQIFYEKGKQQYKIYLSDPEFGVFKFLCCTTEYKVYGSHIVFKHKPDKNVFTECGEAVSVDNETWCMRSMYDPVIHCIGEPFGNKRYHCFRNGQSNALSIFRNGCHQIFADEIRLIGNVPYYRSGNQWWRLDIGSPEEDFMLSPVIEKEVDYLPE